MHWASSILILYTNPSHTVLVCLNRDYWYRNMRQNYRSAGHLNTEQQVAEVGFKKRKRLYIVCAIESLGKLL